jgi:hypothetical protein
MLGILRIGSGLQPYGRISVTEYEYLELFEITKQGTAADGMNCLVIISAYLVAAYVSGRRLPAVFIWQIAILYTMFLAGPTSAALRGFQRMDAISSEFASRFPDSALAPPLIGRAAFFTSGVVVVGWVLSLIFTIYIRKER